MQNLKKNTLSLKKKKKLMQKNLKSDFFINLLVNEKIHFAQNCYKI